MKHFLQENDFSMNEIKEIFYHAFDYKFNRNLRPTNDLAGQSWGLLFQKKSTRTRVSFEVGIRELGGHPLILDQSSTQIGRGESIEDTIKVLSRFRSIEYGFVALASTSIPCSLQYSIIC